MSGKQRLLDAFFIQFSLFLDEVCRVFPNQPEFRAYHAGLRLLRATNPLMVMAEFKRNVEPYETELRKKDDSFFLAHSFDSESGGDPTVGNMINTIKGLWNDETTTPQIKTAILDYVILLLTVCKHYYTI
jgi:hypothetical protein